MPLISARLIFYEDFTPNGAFLESQNLAETPEKSNNKRYLKYFCLFHNCKGNS